MGVLLETLKQFGFSRTWCRWIEECITKVQYSVVVNEEKTTRFRPTRGIRQCGCICAISTNYTRCSGEEDGVDKDEDNLPGDSIFFIKVNEENARALKMVIGKYSATSRQKINLKKSCLQFSAITTVSTKIIVADVLRIT